MGNKNAKSIFNPNYGRCSQYRSTPDRASASWTPIRNVASCTLCGRCTCQFVQKVNHTHWFRHMPSMDQDNTNLNTRIRVQKEYIWYNCENETVMYIKHKITETRSERVKGCAKRKVGRGLAHMRKSTRWTAYVGKTGLDSIQSPWLHTKGSSSSS